MNNRKVLLLSSTASFILQFNLKNINLLKDLNCEVYIACNFQQGNTCSLEALDDLRRELKKLNVQYFDIPIPRKPTDFTLIWKCYCEIKKIIKDNEIRLIHCQTPMGGVIGRLVAKKCKIDTIYTAHGFHFFKGAPIRNWIFYYPIEKLLSYITDTLVTINEEDYSFANAKLSMKHLEMIPGIGIDVRKYDNPSELKLGKYGISVPPKNAIILLSVGELSVRKNHEIVINALANIQNPNMIYLIAGIGPEKFYLEQLVKSLNLSQRVFFLGYLTNIQELYPMADIFCFPSLQEGLPVALMEAMASGLPVVCSSIRGNTDLIVEGKGGYFCDPNSVEQFSAGILNLANSQITREQFGKFNKERICGFDIAHVNEKMRAAYENLLCRDEQETTQNAFQH